MTLRAMLIVVIIGTTGWASRRTRRWEFTLPGEVGASILIHKSVYRFVGDGASVDIQRTLRGRVFEDVVVRVLLLRLEKSATIRITLIYCNKLPSDFQNLGP